MKTATKLSLPLLSLVLFVFPAAAQIVIPISTFPHTIGEYNLSYVRTNLDLSGLVGQTGSNYWDFSQSPTPEEVVSRVDIVAVTDTKKAAAFPTATFAEMINLGPIAVLSWEYYDLDTTNGLLFYGTYDPVPTTGLDTTIPVTPPSSLLPPLVYYGESWTNEYTFDVADPLFGDIPADYQAVATVDAYGTLRLPGFGEVGALRITIVENYSYQLLGVSVPLQSDTNWEWLAPGIGYAAQILSYAQTAITTGSVPYTNFFSRGFFYPPPAPPPALSLALQSNVAALSWSSISNAGGYVLQRSTNLSLTKWQPVAQLTNQSYSVPLPSGAGAQFFRVVSQP